MLFAQEKFPLYIFETKKGGFDGESRDNVLQFFSDSTFTLTNYWRLGGWIPGPGNKSERKGRYIKHGDTLFLDDATSRFALFAKEPTEFEILAINELLQMLPAKIIFIQNTAYYVNHINKLIRLEKLQFLSVTKIEQFYFPFMPLQQGILKRPFSSQLSTNQISF
jgi:hypothetical protein